MAEMPVNEVDEEEKRQPANGEQKGGSGAGPGNGPVFNTRTRTTEQHGQNTASRVGTRARRGRN